MVTLCPPPCQSLSHFFILILGRHGVCPDQIRRVGLGRGRAPGRWIDRHDQHRLPRGSDAVLPCRAAVVIEDPELHGRGHPPAPAGGRLDPADLSGHVKRLDLAGVDRLVLSACVQMPSLAVLVEVRQQTQLPVLSAATATADELLTLLGQHPALE